MPGRQAFPKTDRLRRKREFDGLRKSGRRVSGEHFTCIVARREGAGPKLGLAVSRKVGKSVVRNRIKRYIREVYRKSRAQLAGDVHLLVIARPSAERLGYWECERDLHHIFEKGALFRDA